jgi:hypothetical protein
MKPTAIIVDIDGTLAHMSGRSPYDYSKVSEDALDTIIAGITRRYKHVIVMSGRPEACRVATEKWLCKHDVRFDGLFMRPDGDKRSDVVVKRELYRQFVEPNYSIDFVLDDRNRVVEMWRDNGLKCLQVADGNF